MRQTEKFHIAPEIIFGRGSVMSLAGEIKKYSQKALLIIDPGIKEPPALLESLAKEGIEYKVFRDIEPEPWVETADAAGEAAKQSGCGCVVGIGGGSAMDVAKAAAVLAENTGSACDYQGLNLVQNPGIPKIMVPTTAGTGSEATFTSVLSKKEPKSKAGINSPFLFPETAVLDPELTLGMPDFITATTGMDALTHAVEAYTSLAASVLSDMTAERAIELIADSLKRAVDDGSDIDAREDMLMGSFLGGAALANAGVGAVHALSYPLGGSFRVPHGVANGLLLPYVMKYNAGSCAGKYAKIAKIFKEEGKNEKELAEKAAAAVRKLAEEIKVPLRLSELGIEEKSFEEMSAAAMKVSRPLENNPRKVTPGDAVKIYREAI